jgi:3-hydroxymyristoyl/3-hydroxydecanoyl-(acyl carrier protein) dehydratase
VGITLERFFAPDIRAAAGHFPGNPIIPGAVVLSETLKAIALHLGVPLRPCEIRAAKFFHPARPGDCLQIELTQAQESVVRFTCKVGEQTILTGAVACAAIPARD